jgi:mannose-1-phosphate guanylyltransferase/mannose-1-phosphate guanylyltransferase/mannose-6-phosphate isomerase
MERDHRCGLFPASLFRKRLLSILGEKTPLQQTALHVAGRSLFGEPIVAANAEHRCIIGEQLRQIGISRATIVLEPFGRAAARSTAIAGVLAARSNPDAILLAMPVDHWVRAHVALRARDRRRLGGRAQWTVGVCRLWDYYQTVGSE